MASRLRTVGGAAFACVLAALWHHADLLARIRLTRMAAERGPILSGACGQVGVFHKPWLSKCLPCASPRATEGAVNVSTHLTRAPKIGTGVNGTYLMRRISPTQAPYSMAALRRAAGDGHLERSVPKAVSIRHVQ